MSDIVKLTVVMLLIVRASPSLLLSPSPLPLLTLHLVFFFFSVHTTWLKGPILTEELLIPNAGAQLNSSNSSMYGFSMC